MNQKKLHILFAGVNVSQWIHGNSSLQLSREIDKLRQAGTLFIVGDKESTAREDTDAQISLHQTLVTEDQNQVHWLVIRDPAEYPPRWNGNAAVPAVLSDLSNHVNVMYQEILYDREHESAAVKADRLYQTIMKFNSEQPQQEKPKTSMTYQNYYRHCGGHWMVEWEGISVDRCSQCNKEISPYESIDITKGVDDSPKVHLLFFGANTKQWGVGAEVSQLHSLDSYILSIGDQGDSTEAIVSKWQWFHELILGREERGYTQDRWIIVLDKDTHGFRTIAQTVSGNPTGFLYHHLRPGIHTYLYPSNIPVITQRPEKLCQSIQYYLNRNYSQQPQQDTAMKNQTSAESCVTLLNLLSSARQIIALTPQNALFSPEHVYNELCTLRNSPIYAGQMAKPGIRELVRDVIGVFQSRVLKQIKINKEESNDLILRLDMAIDELKADMKISQEISIAELHSTVIDAISALTDTSSNRNPAGVAERMLHVESYLRHLRDQSIVGASDGGPAEGAVARYLEQALGRLSNDFIAGQRVLEKKFDEMARAVYPHLQNAFLRGPAWNSQPYGPIPPMNSFPQMPDSFSFPKPSSEPFFRPYPHVSSPTQTPQGEFEGVLMIHVVDAETDEKVIAAEGAFRKAFPQASFFVARHFQHLMPPDELIMMFLNASEAQYHTKDIYHLVILKDMNMSAKVMEISSALARQSQLCQQLCMQNLPNAEQLRACLLPGLQRRWRGRF